jgi:hypothetical protein
MTIDKQKLQKLLWAEAASYRADCASWKRNTEALQEFLGEKTVEEVALELLEENEVARMRIKELDLLFGRYILAMRSALIEEEHGKGPVAGMEWIYNSLVGPGQLPPEGEMDSQAYFDREIVAVNNGMDEVFAFHNVRRKAVQP